MVLSDQRAKSNQSHFHYLFNRKSFHLFNFINWKVILQMVNAIKHATFHLLKHLIICFFLYSVNWNTHEQIFDSVLLVIIGSIAFWFPHILTLINGAKRRKNAIEISDFVSKIWHLLSSHVQDSLKCRLHPAIMHFFIALCRRKQKKCNICNRARVQFFLSVTNKKWECVYNFCEFAWINGKNKEHFNTYGSANANRKNSIATIISLIGFVLKNDARHSKQNGLYEEKAKEKLMLISVRDSFIELKGSN